ncbi:hypothetical protein [Treponema sp. R80B11-R83G3]
MKQRMVLGVGLFLYFMTGINGFAQNTGKANFGAYPADYAIAYFSMLGKYPAPTVRQLFGPDAKFATSLRGAMPTIVEIESSNGNANEFTAQLLLTVKAPEKGDLKMGRLIVTFRSDKTAEMSYCRYLKFVNLMNGSTLEERSNGSQDSDGELLGNFVGIMELFWDSNIFE